MESPEITRERIVRIARERFLDVGFSHVLVSDIAAELGMSKKTFYKHFESKEELLRIITLRILSEMQSSIQEILRRDDGFIVKLDGLMTFLGQQLARLGRPLMLDIQRYMPDLWSQVQQFRRERISTDFKGLIKEGVKEGFIRADVNIDVFVPAFIGAAEAVMIPAFLANESFSAREALRGVMTIFFQGILTDHAREDLRQVQRERAVLERTADG